tara:strand:+ start:1752 stop:1883 length:132 start_codon:yes stop_codon:yes gene_type:complete
MLMPTQMLSVVPFFTDFQGNSEKDGAGIDVSCEIAENREGTAV